MPPPDEPTPTSQVNAEGGVYIGRDIVIGADYIGSTKFIFNSNVNSKEASLNSWNQFKESHKYPVYCVFLITASDTEAASFVQKNRPELSRMSGDNCLIIYFHDGGSLFEIGKLDIFHHGINVYNLADIMNINYRNLPCAVFFEDIESEKYVTVDLRDIKADRMLLEFREIFGNLQNDKYHDKFIMMWEYKTGKRISRFFKSIFKIAPNIAKFLPKLPF